MGILIETDRLIMRKFDTNDVDAVFEFASSPVVARFTLDAVVHTREEAARIIQEIWLREYEIYGYARYALVYKGENKVIGFCGMKYEPELGAPDLGYRMLPQYWAQGLGTEAASAALQYARNSLGLRRIMAEAVRENEASGRILLKIGFQLILTYVQDGYTIDRYESNP